MLFYSHSRLFKICLSWGWDVLLVVVWRVLWACLWITCRVLVIPSLHLLHHTFKGLIASSNPSQLKPAHLIFYTEECFMHGLFMFENVVPLCFISDIVCISFRIQGYSVRCAQSSTAWFMTCEKAKNLPLDGAHREFLVACEANWPEVSHKSIVPGCSSPRLWNPPSCC